MPVTILYNCLLPPTPQGKGGKALALSGYRDSKTKRCRLRIKPAKPSVSSYVDSDPHDPLRNLPTRGTGNLLRDALKTCWKVRGGDKDAEGPREPKALDAGFRFIATQGHPTINLQPDGKPLFTKTTSRLSYQIRIPATCHDKTMWQGAGQLEPGSLRLRSGRLDR